MYKWKVTPESSGKRLDVFVAENLPELSRSSIQKLADQKKVTVNKIVQQDKYRVKTGETVSLDYNLDELVKVPKIKIPILYEDEDCIVLNKPAGILTHSKGVFNPEATVATFIAPMLQGLNGDRAGIVHRLDRATSGVIICAKTPEALKWLQKQFSSRKVKKMYIAVVEGKPKQAEAVIDMPIERNPKDPKSFRVASNGKSAVTHYKVMRSDPIFSELELTPTTGRTHQLRVHLSHIGHPIIGDILYGGEPADRLYLHAKSLEITLPNRQRQVFTSTVPREFSAIMK